MYKFSLSVRAYHTARRYGLPRWELWNELPAETMRAACLEAAHAVLAHGRGKKTAAELYRAGGLGVYEIARITGLDLDIVRRDCGRFDQRLHEGLT